MQCKACGQESGLKQKRALDQNNQKDIPEDELEDLCSSCLSIAHECYAGYNVEAEVRDKMLEYYCRYPDFFDFGSELDELFANYKGEQAICNIVSE
jgi:hypothetical protein